MILKKELSDKTLLQYETTLSFPFLPNIDGKIKEVIFIFDLGFDKFIIHTRFCEGDVTIFVDGVQNTDSYVLDFYAHYGKLNKIDY